MIEELESKITNTFTEVTKVLNKISPKKLSEIPCDVVFAVYSENSTS